MTDHEELRSYIYAFLFFLTIANCLAYVGDMFAFGKTYTYIASYDMDKRAGNTIGKGWNCTKNYTNMRDCFENWKDKFNHPDNCKLIRTFPMKIYHVHRWLQYLINPTWHHPYLDIEKIKSGTK